MSHTAKVMQRLVIVTCQLDMIRLCIILLFVLLFSCNKNHPDFLLLNVAVTSHFDNDTILMKLDGDTAFWGPCTRDHRIGLANGGFQRYVTYGYHNLSIRSKGKYLFKKIKIKRNTYMYISHLDKLKVDVSYSPWGFD